MQLRVGGLLLGALAAWAIAEMLVKVLTGVFDPPPDWLSVPWGYLTGLIALIAVAVVTAGWVTLRTLAHPAVEDLRDL